MLKTGISLSVRALPVPEEVVGEEDIGDFMLSEMKILGGAGAEWIQLSSGQRMLIGSDSGWATEKGLWYNNVDHTLYNLIL